MTWYIAINTMSNSSDVIGRVISAHRTPEAATRACRSVQPSQRYSPGSYVPCVVRASERHLDKGAYVPRHTDWHRALTEGEA